MDTGKRIVLLLLEEDGIKMLDNYDYALCKKNDGDFTVINTFNGGEKALEKAKKAKQLWYDNYFQTGEQLVICRYQNGNLKEI